MQKSVLSKEVPDIEVRLSPDLFYSSFILILRFLLLGVGYIRSQLRSYEVCCLKAEARLQHYV
jgi:hypothetical protein